ncbi:MAG: FkbM family methyltransferase [Deltaproteobacteria bacterium]|nr:FkbM family methyltransferase [Deltaproteobacteria bacterium]
MTMLFERERPVIGVLDVGAVAIGGHEQPYERLVSAGLARVVGFEPDVDGCTRLNEKFGKPHCFYPYFIGDGAPATFYQTNWGPTGSLFKPNKPLLEAFQNLHEVMTLQQEHPVETKRLDDIDDLGDIDFVKIDVQGGELAVFRGAERVLANAVLIQTEVEFVELYEGQPLFADIDKTLRGSGYQFHTFTDWGARCFKPLVVNGNANIGIKQFLWSDAIYIKNWLNFDAISIVKLKKLAVLLHDVVGSPDLCHFTLRHLDVRGGTDFAQRYFEAITGTSLPAR